MEHHVQELGIGFAKVLSNSYSLENLKPMGSVWDSQIPVYTALHFFINVVLHIFKHAVEERRRVPLTHVHIHHYISVHVER